MSDPELALGDALRDSDWFADGVLSRVHHDFKNELNLLTNYSELLESDQREGKMVQVVSKKLTASLNALLAGLRLESGSLTPSPENLDPSTLLKERLDWFEPLFEFVDRDVELTVKDPPDELRYDRQFVRLVLDSMLMLGSEEPEGDTGIVLDGAAGSDPTKCFLALSNSNPPWTTELESILRHGSLDELVSEVSSRAGLFLHTTRVLLETQGGHLEVLSGSSDGVVLEAVFRHRKLGPE